MPRRGRLHVVGGCYHVFGRGIERRYIFESDVDKEEFLVRLGLGLKRTKIECLAWALMSNHYHLLLRVDSSPLSALMSGLLGGYASNYNRRHRRVGYVFQNRFTSILCEEDSYLLELVRYIHLNPVRAGMLKAVSDLDHYRWTGHATLMGRRELVWQNSFAVLRHFGKTEQASRIRYKQFMHAGFANKSSSGIFDGGGLVRSVGGWEALARARREHLQRIGDERILGGSSFVESVLAQDSLSLDSKSGYERAGVTLSELVDIVFEYFEIDSGLVARKGRNNTLSIARSVICYLGVTRLGAAQSELGSVLQLSQPGVSISCERGRKYCEANGISIEFLRSRATN